MTKESSRERKSPTSEKKKVKYSGDPQKQEKHLKKKPKPSKKKTHQGKQIKKTLTYDLRLGKNYKGKNSEKKKKD